MAQTAPPSMTAPPTAPSRADSANFSTRADGFLAWFATLYTDMVAALANVYANAVDAYNNAVAGAASAVAALASQNAAAASAQAAAASAGAAIWVSGTTYAIGDVRWSPANRYTYRRITAGAGATDPSADPTNWVLAGAARLQLINASATTQTASANGRYYLSNAAASWIQTPTSPTAGDTFGVLVTNDRIDNSVHYNGTDKIMAQAADMTLANPKGCYELVYVNGTEGWRLVK